MSTKITGLISDYDGTLCPTSSVRSQANTIPEDLEQILWDIARKIPVCIISSKDYHFLHPKTRFARILACIMGIETITFKAHDTVEEIGRRFGNHDVQHGYYNSPDCIEAHLLVKDTKTLQINSLLLSRLAEEISLRLKNNNITIECKFTSDRRFLAGITIDYRRMKNWGSYKKMLEPSLLEIIGRYQSSSSPETGKLHIQTYISHPFLDIYAINCDKGMAFDYTSSKIADLTSTVNQRVMYMGDSENDNAAFVRADVSIGVVSDDRLKPKLSCTNTLKFDVLSQFLKKLLDNDLVFTSEL